MSAPTLALQLAAPMLLEIVEEIRIRATEVLDGLLWCVLGYSAHPRKPVILDRVERLALSDFGRLCAAVVLALPFSQSPVVREPRDPASTTEMQLLLERRYQTDATCQDHAVA